MVNSGKLQFYAVAIDQSRSVKAPNAKAAPNPAAPPGANWDNGVAAGVRLLSKGIVLLHDYGLKRNEQSALAAPTLVDRILKIMPAGGGVLVEMQYDQWGVSDIVGNIAKHLVGAVICGAARTPLEALNAYLSSDRLAAAPPEGWIRSNKFMWAVREA
jgi:hypothetical protein